jgi:hypothetical protein
MTRRSGLTFSLRSVAVWLVMVVVLVVVPDWLEQWIPLHIARIIGWVLASGIWVAVLERDWQERFGPIARFVLLIVVWLAAALTASWISDLFRPAGY